MAEKFSGKGVFQIGVSIRKAFSLTDGFQFSQSFFADAALKITVAFAEEYPARGKAKVSDGAFVGLVVGTLRSRHFFLPFCRQFFFEVDDLWCRYE